MVTSVRRLEPEDRPSWRAVRLAALAALAEAPQAFASSLAKDVLVGQGPVPLREGLTYER